MRYRNYLSTKTKLYHKTTREYKIKIVLKEQHGKPKIATLKPIKYRGFLPLGNIVVPHSNLKRLDENDSESPLNPYQEFSSYLVSGAVDHPKDYELLWDNKYFVEDTSFSRLYISGLCI